MNKHLYRIIFNKKRDQWMAVGECASADGKSASGEATAAGRSLHGPVGATLLVTALSSLAFAAMTLFNTADAQIIVDPSAPASQRATVLSTASGLPQVNITAPSAGGVSRNTFNQFDIQSQGAILNNSRTNVQTQLGGFIQGNPALAAGSARVILNEVNSANPTQLRGFVEVGGQRAEVIIANPAGIQVDGGGFINATRATLTTGTAIMNGGNLDGFLVQKGVISINGAGLNSTQTDFTGLMARAIEVNAGIWAKELKVTAGANQVNAYQSVATAAPGSASGTAPAFAIDTALLGGMYAGKITLVGTELGLGVRSAGTIAASAGNVAISANGLLSHAATASLTSTADINVTATTVVNDGQITAAGLADITATGTLTNNKLIKGGDVQLQADTLANTSAGQVEGGTVNASAQTVTNAGQFNASGQLGVSTTGTLTNQGKLVGQQTTVQAATLNNQGAGRIEGDAVDVTASTVNNTSGIAGNTVTVTAGTLNNQGTSALIAGTSQVNLYVTNALNNTAGATVYSLGDLNIAANGARDAGDTLLNRTALVNNDSSLLQGDNDVQIAAQTFNNVRPAPAITSSTSTSNKTLVKASGYWMCEYGNYIDSFAGYCANHYANMSWYNPAIHINPYGERPGMFIGGWMVETERYTTTTVTTNTMTGTLQPEPKVLAGRNLILKNVGNLRNEYGTLAAGQDVTIGNADPLGAYQTASVTNIGGLLNQTTGVDEYSVFRWNRSYSTAISQSIAPTSSTVVLGRIGGTLSAGRNFTVNAGSVVNTNALPGQSNTTGAASPAPAGTAFVIPAVTALVIPPPTNPTQGYLIQSDPRFTDYRTWLSSDYMLSALGTDPALMQKRLGDGFYEQRLIREQVGQLTGRRFLDGYADDEAQYQALMTNGVTVAQQWNLRPGVALTAAQVASLTSDMVWLVEQTVKVSDGKGGTVQTQAWVPVVYLSQIHAADLHPTGALISGKSVNIAAQGDLTNNGALQAEGSILLAANKVTNELGLIDASQGSTQVSATTDIVNRSSLISGSSVQLSAGRDIQLDTVTRQITASRQTSAGQVSGSNSEVGPQGSVVSRGDLTMSAGRDIRLAGALASAQGNANLSAGANLVVDTLQTQQSTQDVSVMGVRRSQGTTNLASSLQTGGDLTLSSGADTTLQAAQISAGQNLTVVSQGNLNITAATDTTQLDENMRAKGYVRNDHTAQERVVGSNLVAGDNVTLAAMATAPDASKGNITIQGSSVNAVTGQLTVAAANNVNIVEAREKGEYDLFNETKGSKTFSSKTQTARDTGSSDIAVGSALSGRNISITAGKDLTVRGSSVVSDNKTTLLATNNVTVEAAKNFETSTTFREEKKSGLMSSSGIGFTVGKRQQSTDQQNQQTTASAATVGSIAGNVTATAGQAYRQVGSDVMAPGGDVTIAAKTVDIVEARETSRSATEQKFKQSGVSVSLGSPLISAVQGAQSLAQAASQTSDARMQALAVAATAFNVYNNASEIKGAASALASGDVSKAASLSVSVGSSKSQSTSSSQSDTARGSTIAAGNNLTIQATGAGQASDLTVQGSSLTAGNSVTLLADNQIKLLAAQNTSSQTSNNSSSSGSIGVSLGASTGATLSASKARGNADGSDTSFANTQVNAGSTASLTSGADTTIKGAVVSANQINADIGGNLTIQSLQDTSTYTSQQSSAGGSLTFGTGGLTGGGISAGKSNINSNYQSVTETSGLKAGDGGFQVTVNSNTDLKGSVIASTDQAILNDKNSLTTATLTISDLQNKAEALAGSSSINLNSDVLGQGKYGVAKALLGNMLDNAIASGGSLGQTKSAVSVGAVTITDNARQHQLTGKNAEQTVASLSRDTAGAHTAAQRQDVKALQQTVEAERAIRQEAVKQFTALSDDAYRVMFKESPKFYKLVCPSGADCTKNPELTKTELVKGTPEQVQAELTKAGKGAVLAVNGIDNPLERAGQLAMQNAEPVNKTEQNPAGEKPPAIYLMHYIPASNGISELMVAAYEKSLASTLGYTNQDHAYADALKARGNDETISLGHSRGTIVQTNANRILADQGFTNSNLAVRGVGGAVGAQVFTDAAAAVQGPKGDKSSITFNYFKTDPVPVATGGNPGVLSLSEFWQVLKTSNSAHSCYGTGAAGCRQTEILSPNAPSGATQDNSDLVRYKGGIQVDSNNNPINTAK